MEAVLAPPPPTLTLHMVIEQLRDDQADMLRIMAMRVQQTSELAKQVETLNNDMQNVQHELMAQRKALIKISEVLRSARQRASVA